MPRNVYSETNLHLTWQTKHDAPVLVDIVENRTHHYLRHRALQTPGVFVHEIGGTADHIHLAVGIRRPWYLPTGSAGTAAGISPLETG